MTTSLSVNAADYDELKQSFVTWLKTQPQFADYQLDRPGDNMNALLGVLAYNTYLNLFYHNMAVNETFIDTAQQRDSTVSRAKELNYTPRSFTSASASVNIAVTSNNLTRSSVILGKGTLFTSRIGDRSYSFTTDRSYVSTTSTISGSTIIFTFSNILLFEGFYLTETIPYDPTVASYIIPNEQVDTSSINVTSIEDNGGNIIPYIRAVNLFNINSSSPAYFIQGSPGSKYEIIFGDGTFGRVPKANSLVAIDYRISNGELPNGATVFAAGQPIDSETNIVVTTIVPANGGSVFESIDSIRLNAPKHFASQGNAVAASDYKSLLIQSFPEIVDLIAYGGEDAIPPQFGRVFVSVVLNGIDFLPQVKQDQYYAFLRTRSLMKPVFINPEFIYIQLTTNVHYDLTKTTINPDDIRILVLAAILGYNSTSLNKFQSVLRFSRLGAAIDAAHPSITSNESSVILIRELTSRDFNQGSFNFNYGAGLISILSEPFLIGGVLATISNSGSDLVLNNTTTGQLIRNVGTVNMSSGKGTITFVSPDSALGVIKMRGVPAGKDVSAGLNSILKIRDYDTLITVVKN